MDSSTPTISNIVSTSDTTTPILAITPKQKKTPSYTVKAQLAYIERLKLKDMEAYKKSVSLRNKKFRTKAKEAKLLEAKLLEEAKQKETQETQIENVITQIENVI